jgi:hypothetical protein
MLRKVLLSAIFVLGTLSLVSAANFAGKWKGNIAGPQGDFEMTIVIKSVTTDSLSGVIQTSMGEMPMTNTKLSGETFTFDISFNEMTMHHTCTATDTQLTIKSPGMNGEERVMVFERVKE